MSETKETPKTNTQEPKSEKATENLKVEIGKNVINASAILTAVGLTSALAMAGNNAIRNFMVKKQECERHKINTLTKSIFESVETVVIPLVNLTSVVMNIIRKK